MDDAISQSEKAKRLRSLREAIDAKLLAALDSGEPEEATPEWWEARREELRRRIEAQQAQQSHPDCGTSTKN